MEKLPSTTEGRKSGPASVIKCGRFFSNCQRFTIIKVMHDYSPLFSTTSDKTLVGISCATIGIVLLKVHTKILLSH